MANKDYNFQYTPLTGRLPGNSFVKQTEQAINELAGIVNEGAAQVEVITNLANTANDNAEEALEKANEALSTASRVYITLPNLDDADDYFDSQLYYFANSNSHNLPVVDTGFLEVKTNDTKTACEQVFIADDTGLCYFRHGVITSEEVGSETVYSVTWETWSSELASEDYVQGELLNYLPLSGGTITGNLVTSNSVNVKSGSIAPVNTLQRSTAYSVDDIVYTSELNAKYYLLCVTAGTTSAAMPSFSGAGSNTEVTDGTVVWRVQTITSQEKAAGFPIGFEYFQMNPNIPRGSLPLFGGEYDRATYSDLWAWVQTQTGYLKTEAEWQQLYTTNAGNVPFYSDGDGSTTFRVPSLKCWVRGANGTVSEVGSYLEAGLPNITGGNSLQVLAVKQEKTSAETWSGAIGTPASYATAMTTGGTGTAGAMFLMFNASKSNAIYGNSTTVQPESIVGLWLVKAYGVIVDTGQIDEQQYIDDRMADLKNVYLPANYVPNKVVDLSNDITFNITSGNVTLLGGGLNVYKIGNMIHGYFALTSITNISVGSNITFDIGGIPLPLTVTHFCGYISQSALVGNFATNGSVIVRVIGAQVNNNASFGMSFMYPIGL